MWEGLFKAPSYQKIVMNPSGIGQLHANSGNGNKGGFVDPDLAYTLEGASQALGKSSRWIKEHLIKTRKIQVARCGDFVGIPGWVFIKWMTEILEWDDPDAGEPLAVDNPPAAQKSKSSRRRGRPPMSSAGETP
jgi:hypothetical protein